MFASSLDRVVHDGRFYGSNFDILIDFDDGPPADADVVRKIVDTLATDPDVDRVGEMRITEISVERPARDVARVRHVRRCHSDRADDRRGSGPEVAGEIALGLTTMRELDVGVGDVVDVVDRRRASGTAEVVGRAVLPGVGLYQGSDRTSIGVGAIVAPDALGPRTSATKGFMLVGLKPGADLDDFESQGEQLAECVRAAAVFQTGQPARRTSKVWCGSSRCLLRWHRCWCSSSA